ncbi:hypothetical protein GW17_00050463 [Ensete ventricosum]|nr:hypothetical protein GW17_00050463 [Ensete ventricosum]
MSLPERSLCLYAIDGWATNPALVTGVVITMRGQSRRMAHRLAVSMIDAAVAVRTLSGTVACRNRCDHRCCVKKEVNLFLIGLTLIYHSPYLVVVLANLSFSLSPSLFPASLETLLKPPFLSCLNLPPHWHRRRLPRRRQDLKDPRHLHSPLQALALTPSSKAIISSFSSALARFLTNAVEASSASTIAATLF